MLVMAAELNYPLINVVRREAQAELLKSLGAKYVLNSSSEAFAAELQSLCKQLKATAAFEAVAGDMTGTVLNAMPHSSTAYVYGALSQEPAGTSTRSGSFSTRKRLPGFYLGGWLERRGVFGTLRAASRLQRMIIDGRIGTTIQRQLALDQVVEGLSQYSHNMTEGKVLIMPHGPNASGVQ